MKHFHWINENPDQDYSSPRRVKFKIRHTPEFTGGSMVKKNNLYVLESDEAIAGIAAGQFGVIYDENSE